MVVCNPGTSLRQRGSRRQPARNSCMPGGVLGFPAMRIRFLSAANPVINGRVVKAVVRRRIEFKVFECIVLADAQYGKPSQSWEARKCCGAGHSRNVAKGRQFYESAVQESFW